MCSLPTSSSKAFAGSSGQLGKSSAGQTGIDRATVRGLQWAMHLLRMRMTRQGPFDEIELGFGEPGEPRLITVVHGGGGVGKTTLLMALASTRPGHAVVGTAVGRDHIESGFTACEFHLGQDDPERPHALVVATPNARVYADDEREALRRREQALFDRVAREAGFVFVSIPATRWFSRQPIAIVGAARGLGRYDVRAPIPLEDPTRGDLARETKQTLAYAAITQLLGAQAPDGHRFERLADAMLHAVDTLVGLAGYCWVGLDPLSLEPLFRANTERVVQFDGLPTRVRHLVALAALPVRALWAAYPERDPLEAEGIVAIDEVDLHQDPTLLSKLVPALRLALPKVQWIVTTTSPVVAASCEVTDVIALRRRSEQDTVELFTGELARTH
jgi:hypothetical protein